MLLMICFGRVTDAKLLGAVIRAARRSQHLTLEKVSGLTNVSMRFLSELERGKETAQLGKVLSTLNDLGLDIIIQPRDFEILKAIGGECALIERL